METPIPRQRIPTGPAAAALLATGVGILVIGALTTGAAISPWLNQALDWHQPTGPLSGKTTVGVVVWLIAWALLRIPWKEKEVRLKGVVIVTLALIVMGLAFTFPPVFGAFQPGH